jgi:ATP-dependent RNA helicase DHX29
MPNRKKKKTQPKPVARGFAVTSIPKKAPPESPPRQDEGGSPLAESPQQVARLDEPVEDEATSRQRAEEQSLQVLVEKLQEKTEKEIVRTVKVPVHDSPEHRWFTQLALVRPFKRIGGFPTPCRCLTWVRISLVKFWRWHAKIW